MQLKTKSGGTPILEDRGGWEVLRAAQEVDQTTQVIIITNLKEKEEEAEARRKGAYGWINRAADPFIDDIRAVQDMINDALVDRKREFIEDK